MTGGIHRFLHILSVFSARYPPFPQASPRWLTAEVASVRVGTTFGFIARNRTCPDTSRRQSSGRNANWRPACNLSVIAGVARRPVRRTARPRRRVVRPRARMAAVGRAACGRMLAVGIHERTGAGARARRAGERGAHSGAARGAVSGATGQWRRAARGAEYRLGQAGIRI